MAAPKAPLLDAAGQKSKDVTLEDAVFGAEVKPHLVHETVRAEMNADRSGTRGLKSRGRVSGGRSKPWRQKGTGRARAGTTRAPHWTGGGVAFQPRTEFGVKVNRKVRRSALRGALSSHAANGTLGVLDAGSFDTASTKRAAELLASWGKDAPVVVIATDDEQTVVKSFRNLERVVVTAPSELEVSAVVWARSLLVTQDALQAVQARAAAQPPVRAERGPVEGARGNREVPSTRKAES
jgi:large subunit ribosomal protein L4